MSKKRLGLQFSLWCAFALQFPYAARAHDTWVLPRRDHAPPGDTVRFALATGMLFPRSEIATRPERVNDWVVAGPSGRVKLSGFKVEANDLTARCSFKAPGAYVIAVALRPNFILIEAGDFEAYLSEEHATDALGRRQAAQESHKPGREVYTKLAKTFVQIGDGGASQAVTRPVGHPLEIVPLSNPLEWRLGDEVRVRVLLHGKPVEGLTVSTLREGLPPHAYVEVRTTDAEGVVRVRLPRPGLWLIRTHYIHRVPDLVFDGEIKSTIADWESYFASVVFRVPRPDHPQDAVTPRP